MSYPYNHPFQRPQGPLHQQQPGPPPASASQQNTSPSYQQYGQGTQQIGQASVQAVPRNVGNNMSGPPSGPAAFNPSSANSGNQGFASSNRGFATAGPPRPGVQTTAPLSAPSPSLAQFPGGSNPNFQQPMANGYAPYPLSASGGLGSAGQARPLGAVASPPANPGPMSPSMMRPGFGAPPTAPMPGMQQPPRSGYAAGMPPPPTGQHPPYGIAQTPPQAQNYMPPSTGFSSQPPNYSSQQPGYPSQSAGYQPQPGYPGQQPSPYPPQNYQAENSMGAAPRGPQQPATGAQAPKQRIDPAQIPRPPIQREPITYVARGHTMTAPPPASADYVAIDNGCCNPRFIRPTLNYVPQTKEIAKQCEIPIAAIICPLAKLERGEEDVPIVDFGPEGPLRCSRCKAYLNCFTKFIQGGRKFVCNICTMQNDTPRDYQCNMDEHGRRRDIMERPELSKGSVEFIVPSEYMIRPAQEQIFVFVIDVSVYSVQSGFLIATLDAIKERVLELPESTRTKIGIATFDRRIHYYKINQKLKQPEILVCPDIDEPFAPLPHQSWLIPLHQSREDIELICDQILQMFAETKVPDGASGSALQSVAISLEEVGGKVMLFQSALPKIGVGRVTREEATRFYGTDKERELYCADENDKFYQKLAENCAMRQISVDLFISGNDFADVGTVGQLCLKTGGRLRYLPYFGKEPAEDALKIQKEIQKSIDDIGGLEAVLKVRVSTGLRVENHYGNFLDRSGLGQEVEMAAVHRNQAIAVTFVHDDDLTEGNDVYIQAALLYTTLSGQRCVRVHNLALQVAPLLSNVFRYADLEAAVCVYLKQGVQVLKEKDPHQAREQHLNNCVGVLHNYRKFCASASSSGQLILPESLKLLPLYTLAMIKSVAFRSNLSTSQSRSGVDVKLDERASLLMLVNSLRSEHAISMVYPKMYALHGMQPECGTPDRDGKIILPMVLPPTAEHLSDEGIFLLVSSSTLHMYIGAKAPSSYLCDLFGAEAIDTAEHNVTLMQGTSNEYKSRVQSIIETVRKGQPMHLQLEIITRNDWRAARFMSLLIEDRTKNDMSYVEFLCQVHKSIQTRFQ